MVVGSRVSVPSWMSAAAATRVDLEGSVSSVTVSSETSSKEEALRHSEAINDFSLGFAERAFSAAGAAIVSAVIVNPLDVAKTRLQAQAAGVPYEGLCRTASFESNMMLSDMRNSPSCTCAVPGTEPAPECNRYKGTLDLFYKVVRQEGFARLWRGTYASLALSVPTVGIYLPCYDGFRNLMENFTTGNAPMLTPYVPLVAGSVARSLACISCYPIELARTRMQAFTETQSGVKPPGVWKTLVGVVNPLKSRNSSQKCKLAMFGMDNRKYCPCSLKFGFQLMLNEHMQLSVQNYRILWTGVGAQLARDVPFSAICWSTLEPIRRSILSLVGDDARVTSILGANFTGGFVAGSIAAAATCPLDVSRTRHQIEFSFCHLQKDPTRALNMTTRQTLMEIWRDGGMKGLFTGVGPRVARAGPSVGIVVSFYEVVKYALYQRHQLNN
ncbi:mitochondrial carrier protein MTM1 [Citrus sinensis]|uniref:Mitochondrial carrier protein MTM1 n=1 Tax=Citrus sinensis TaxID=2711 RepID=A0ACB8MPM8_CITSI|nr:mitochondrial carrier protein MTM1 [Citrus sinensis]KAH9732374.1 mitochondrial carrier protein MTM1 [Citrus sinensis]KAH9787599.1 mitochondrial carrier protein MTM1 [Citrus sinensis]